jgi:hypothetical protein
LGVSRTRFEGLGLRVEGLEFRVSWPRFERTERIWVSWTRFERIWVSWTLFERTERIWGVAWLRTLLQ